MIKAMSHASIYVLDQDEAKDFYTDKLGFEVRNDISGEGFRWLTVGPKEQPDFHIVLMPIGPPLDDAAASSLRKLVAEGGIGGGVMATDDCRATYADLTAKGVTFLQEPAERPYGVEAIFRDNSGVWFSLTQQTA